LFHAGECSLPSDALKWLPHHQLLTSLSFQVAPDNKTDSNWIARCELFMVAIRSLPHLQQLQLRIGAIDDGYEVPPITIISSSLRTLDVSMGKHNIIFDVPSLTHLDITSDDSESLLPQEMVDMFVNCKNVTHFSTIDRFDNDDEVIPWHVFSPNMISINLAVSARLSLNQYIQMLRSPQFATLEIFHCEAEEDHLVFDAILHQWKRLKELEVEEWTVKVTTHQLSVAHLLSFIPIDPTSRVSRQGNQLNDENIDDSEYEDDLQQDRDNNNNNNNNSTINGGKHQVMDMSAADAADITGNNNNHTHSGERSLSLNARTNAQSSHSKEQKDQPITPDQSGNNDDGDGDDDEDGWILSASEYVSSSPAGKGQRWAHHSLEKLTIHNQHHIENWTIPSLRHFIVAHHYQGSGYVNSQICDIIWSFLSQSYERLQTLELIVGDQRDSIGKPKQQQIDDIQRNELKRITFPNLERLIISNGYLKWLYEYIDAGPFLSYIQINDLSLQTCERLIDSKKPMINLIISPITHPNEWHHYQPIHLYLNGIASLDPISKEHYHSLLSRFTNINSLHIHSRSKSIERRDAEEIVRSLPPTRSIRLLFAEQSPSHLTSFLSQLYSFS
jgi:hypothetical protein